MRYLNPNILGLEQDNEKVGTEVILLHDNYSSSEFYKSSVAITMVKAMMKQLDQARSNI